MDFNSENLQLKSVKKRIAIPLLIWGGLSVIAGSFYLVSPLDLLRGVLLQAFFWGVIDGIIGLISFLGKKDPVLEKINKILLINIYLDILYIIIGVIIIILSTNAFMLGNGYGVIIQGSFLFIVDFIHHDYIKKSFPID